MDEHNIRPINVFQVYVAIKEVTVEFEKVKVNGIPMLLEESQPRGFVNTKIESRPFNFNQKEGGFQEIEVNQRFMNEKLTLVSHIINITFYIDDVRDYGVLLGERSRGSHY